MYSVVWYSFVLTDEVIKEVLVYVEQFINGSNLFLFKPGGPKVLPKSCAENRVFVKKPYYYNGECFALALPQCILDASVLELTIKFFEKTDMFVHHPGQFLNPNSR